jgi:anti-sigma regulatory factor (Ser/Thr protein kinase)
MMAANPAGADPRPAEGEPGLRWARAFPGSLDQVAAARRFVACLLEECPARDALVACTSELAANAVVHTASGDDGFFTVEVCCPRGGVARVLVTDAGGPTEPAAGAPVEATATDEAMDDLPVCGLGLAVVAASTSRWGWYDAGPGRTVWAEASWPVAVLAAPRVPRVVGAARNWRDGGGAA